MDPAGSSRESDLARIFSLWERVSHASDIKAMSIGINAIEAILKGNPHLHELSGFSGLLSNLQKAKETVQIRELVIPQQRPPQSGNVSTLLPLDSSPSTLHSDCHSPAAFLAAMWSEDEEPAVISPSLPVSSITAPPASRRKRHSRRRRATPQPDIRPSNSPAVLPEAQSAPSLLLPARSAINSTTRSIFTSTIASVISSVCHSVALSSVIHTTTCFPSTTTITTPSHSGCYSAQVPPEPLAQFPVAVRFSSQLNVEPGVPILSGSTSALAGSSDELIQDSAAPTPPSTSSAGGSTGK
ncbi:uncharacterized protein LOC113037582 [Astatotilapia calliptera]|uniref:uncharacterized protein LOC113037582 n=1 Tax=Astatotilapia calliptera TaxID=8154 RepID=UPI000E42AF39|nr:uncharacterized protein LOC113037582 [Astatotilapia calliptera]